jgi:hypothetical protein
MTTDLPGNVYQPLKGIIMKLKFTATALILASGLIASTSFAADSGTLTREQVRAEYFQARAEGSLPQVGEGQLNNIKSAPSTLTREAVMTEYFAAEKAGTLPQVGEGQLNNIKSAPSTLTREAVMAKYFATEKAGTLLRVGERG